MSSPGARDSVLLTKKDIIHQKQLYDYEYHKFFIQIVYNRSHFRTDSTTNLPRLLNILGFDLELFPLFHILTLVGTLLGLGAGDCSASRHRGGYV